MSIPIFGPIHSPLNIGVLLHCHVSPDQHPNYENVKEVLDALETVGAIAHMGEGTYSTTPLGAAWVKALCNVPPPRQAFIDENGKVL